MKRPGLIRATLLAACEFTVLCAFFALMILITIPFTPETLAQ